MRLPWTLLGFLGPLLWFSGSGPAAWAAAPTAEQLEGEADSLYQAGNCEKAIAIYRSLFHRPGADPQLRDLIRFRISYCQLELGHDLLAKRSFEDFLRSFPRHDEARLRYAEALFRLGEHGQARQNALQVQESELLPEALLLAAHADMALHEFDKALYRLNEGRVGAAWRPVFFFWKGIAAHRKGALHRSLEHFRSAREEAAPGHWVTAQADEWLEQIGSELRFLRGHFGFSYFSDNNVAQQSYLAVDRNGTPVTATPNEPSYLSDTGMQLSLGLSALLQHSESFRFFAAGDLTAPFHKNYKTYNNQNLSGSLTAQFPLSSELEWSLSPRFLWSKYDWEYYQNYLSLDSDLSWSPRESLRGNLNLNVTRNVQTRPSTSFSAGTSASYHAAAWLVFSGGLSYTRAVGELASYVRSAGGSAVFQGGTMFSRYRTRSANASLTLSPLWELWLKLSVSRSWSAYDDESVPVPANSSAPPPRDDVISTASAELSRAIVRNHWYLSTSLTLTRSRSSGYQGLASSGLISSYSYDRAYLVVGTQLLF